MKWDRRVLAVTGAVIAVAAAIGILASGGSEHARPVRRPAPAPLPRGRPEVAKSVPMRAGAPTGVAYGHGRVWVTRSDGTVVRLKPKTGRLVDKTRVGRFPVRIAIDRDAAWVVDDETGMLSELDVRDAHVLRRTRVCDTASGVASTGDTVWV